MNRLKLCDEETRNQCAYFTFSQSGDDALDIIASLIAYFVLWIFPEKTLFPTGFALYVIPCIFSCVKYCRRNTPKWQKWAFGFSVFIISIIAFLGVFQTIHCHFSAGTHQIVLEDYLQALIGISHFPTVVLLIAAGIPLLFNAKRYIFPQRKIHPKAPVVTS